MLLASKVPKTAVDVAKTKSRSRAARLTATNNHSATRVRQDAEALVRTRREARLEEWLGAEASERSEYKSG